MNVSLEKLIHVNLSGLQIDLSTPSLSSKDINNIIIKTAIKKFNYFKL